MDTLDDNVCRCKIISRSVLLRMRNVSDKSCRENKTTQFMFHNSSPPTKLMPVYDTVWENVVEPDMSWLTK